MSTETYIKYVRNILVEILLKYLHEIISFEFLSTDEQQLLHFHSHSHFN